MSASSSPIECKLGICLLDFCQIKFEESRCFLQGVCRNPTFSAEKKSTDNVLITHIYMINNKNKHISHTGDQGRIFRQKCETLFQLLRDSTTVEETHLIKYLLHLNKKNLNN